MTRRVSWATVKRTATSDLSDTGSTGAAALRNRGLKVSRCGSKRMSFQRLPDSSLTNRIFDQGMGYEVNGRPIDHRNWWMDQVRKAIAFDWSPYVQDDTPPSLDELAWFTRAVVEGTLSTRTVEVRSRCE